MSCCDSTGPPKHLRAPKKSDSEMCLSKFNRMYLEGVQKTRKRERRSTEGRKQNLVDEVKKEEALCEVKKILNGDGSSLHLVHCRDYEKRNGSFR